MGPRHVFHPCFTSLQLKAIDTVVEGLEESKSAWIISEYSDEIGDAINARLGRGVTYLHGEGAYTGDDKKVIFCIITRLEESKLKTIVEDFDPTAFLAVARYYGSPRRTL